MLVSIIVPIYNTKEYLSVCLDSILNQTYKKIEIILVDDGSTDGSLDICKDYAKRDSRIYVFQGSHKGLVEARKIGIKKSHGIYCIFVDSDDWIAKNLVESMILLTYDNSVDIINYNIKSVNNSKTTEWNYTVPQGVYENQSLENIYKKMMFDFEKGRPGIIQSLWSKMIKREVLWKSIRYVDSRITLGEDAAVVYHAMLIAKKIVVIYDYLYFYRIHIGSMYNSKSIDIFNKIYIFQKYMQSIFANCNKKYILNEQLQAYLTLFINKGMSDLLSLKMHNLYHIPFYLPEIGRKIILYGAGVVGKSYYRQLMQDKGIKVVAWVDRELTDQRRYDCKIESPEIITNIDFDRILIAVKSQKVATEIMQQLYEIVPAEKIIWGEPKYNWWEREIDI